MRKLPKNYKLLPLSSYSDINFYRVDNDPQSNKIKADQLVIQIDLNNQLGTLSDLLDRINHFILTYV